MSKVTLDMSTFKALASDTRLDILKALDGKKMSLKDISKATSLNKATLHEHLAKLHEAGLVKRKERDGHKWVYYKLSWKGECLLHPENTRIVVLFTTTFITLWAGIIQLMWFVKGKVTDIGYDIYSYGEEVFLTKKGSGVTELEEKLVDFGIDDGAKSYVVGGGGSFIPQYCGANTTVETFKCLPDSDSLTNEWMALLTKVKETTNSPQVTTNSLTKLDNIPTGENLSFAVPQSDSIAPQIPGVNEGTRLVVDHSEGVMQAIYQDPTLIYIAIACFIICTVVLCIGLWRLWENRTQKI